MRRTLHQQLQLDPRKYSLVQTFLQCLRYKNSARLSKEIDGKTEDEIEHLPRVALAADNTAVQPAVTAW